MRTSLFAAITLSLALAAGSLAQTRKTLDIYLVDVEGGNATLFVAPSGESLLIDTGNGGPAAVRGCRSHPGRRQGCGTPADRPPDHDALARRSFRRHGRSGLTHPDPRVHRPRAERPARPGSRRVPREDVSAAVRKGTAPCGKAGRQDRNRRPRRPRGCFSGAGAQDSAGRRRQTEPVLRRLHASGRRPVRKRAVGRQPHHVRQVSRRCTWAISR